MRFVLRVVVAVALMSVAWGIGHAQGQAQSFVLKIVAPGGTTSVECVSGCTFRYVRVATDGTRRTFDTPSFTQGCPNATCEISASGVVTP